jgi:hypothetical protein
MQVHANPNVLCNTNLGIRAVRSTALCPISLLENFNPLLADFVLEKHMHVNLPLSLSLDPPQ